MKHHNVYVIELDPKVLDKKKFAEANPNHRVTLPCLYVGMTGLTPEQRFANHLAGRKGSRYVREFGRGLANAFFRHLGPMGFDEARLMETALAKDLRDQGYAVWQA